MVPRANLGPAASISRVRAPHVGRGSTHLLAALIASGITEKDELGCGAGTNDSVTNALLLTGTVTTGSSSGLNVSVGGLTIGVIGIVVNHVNSSSAVVGIVSSGSTAPPAPKKKTHEGNYVSEIEELVKQLYTILLTQQKRGPVTTVTIE